MVAGIGDYVVLFRATGGCDLFTIDEARARVSVRTNLPTPQDARRIARAAMQAGRQIWVCDEAHPNIINPY